MKKVLTKVFTMLLAAAIILTSTNVEMLFAAEDAGTVTSTKSAVWTDEGKTLDIIISETKTAGDTNVPQILFLGTLCGSHSLTKTAVIDSLTATVAYGDVDYYIYQRSRTSSDDSSVTKTTGTFAQNTSSSTISSKIPSLVSGMHASVYDFGNILAEISKSGKKYDYIVMEFDGMRLGHYQNAASATDIANIKIAADYLKTFYAAGKVAWIIPPLIKKNGDYNYAGSLSNKKTTGTYIYNDYFFDNLEDGKDATINQNYHDNVRNTLYLIAPEDLSSSKEVTGTLAEQETLIARTTADDDERIWVSYEEADQVKIFLEEKIGTFCVNIEDVVTPGLTVTGVKGQYIAKNSSKWTDIPAANTNSTGTKGTNTMFYYKTSEIATGTKVVGTFDLSKIYTSYKPSLENNVRMIISCELAVTDPDETGYLFTEANNYTINTNVGDAVVTISDGPATTAQNKTSPTLGAYPITYSFVGDRTTETDDAIPTGTSISFGGAYTAEALPTPTGYTIDGWYTDKTCETPFVDETEINAPLTLYGKCVPKEHSITWVTDGDPLTGDFTSGSGIKYNTAITAPDTPTKTGYSFKAWNPSVPSKMPDASKTFTATWNANSYTICFNANTGDGTMADQSFDYGTAKKLQKNTFTKTGYNFTGWNTISSGAGISYTDEESVKNLSATDGDTITLYAQWEIGQYDMTWVTDGDPLTGDYTKGKTVYGSPLVKPNDPTRTGYEFTGWTPEIPGTVPGTDKTFTAGWVPIPYTVVYDGNGGEGSMDDQAFIYDQAQNLNENKFSITGYHLNAWNTDASGNGTAYADKASVKNLTTTSGAAVTLYAQWSPNTYQIQFLANQGTGTMGKQTHTYGSALNLSENQFSRTGHTFLGWAVDPAASAIDYADKASVKNLTSTPSAVINLYALWQVNDYTVTLVGNGGEGTDLTQYTYGNNVTLPTDWVKDNAEFIGWFEDADFSGTAVTQIKNTDYGNKTYYAKWRLTAAYDLFDEVGGMATGLDSVILETGDEIVLLYGAPQSVDPTNWTKDAPDQYHMTITDSVKVPNPETRTTYQFAGWDVTNVSGTVTFAAQWLRTDIEIPADMENKITEVGTGLMDYAKAKLAELNAGVGAGDTARIQELAVVMTVDALSAEEIKSADADQSVKDIVNIAEGRVLIAYDITIESTVTTRNWDGSQWVVEEQTPQTVTDTGAPIVIRVPFDYTRKKDIKAYRYHDAADVFTAEPNALGEYCEEKRDLNALDIHAQLFSTYAIGYRNVKKKSVAPAETGVDNTLNTEDHIAYMVGYTDGSVRPMNNMTRAEAAMVFYHLLKDPTCDNPVSFKDVEEGKWYTVAIETLAGRGFISGYPDGSFRPDRPITRAEFTAISMHFAKDPDGMGAFGDVGPTHWANNAIASASAYSWVTGYSDGTFQPNKTITRAEVSSIVNRMLGRYADEDFVNQNLDLITQFSDLQDNTKWYFFQLVEATNAHDPAILEGNELWSVDCIK